MKTVLNNLKIPLLSLLLTGSLAAAFMPYVPIDETRYVSVAWEMQNTGSYLVPVLNGEPYSHKPPLLFWLIQAGWKIFGVNDMTPRMIPVFFGMLSLFLFYRICRMLWPEEKKTAYCASLVLGTTAVWMLWACLVMFDVILTFWILLAVTGMLYSENRGTLKKGWLMLALGAAGGLLTKGPVVLVYILPPVFLHSLWSSERIPRWRLLMTMAVLAGFGLALLWAVPAAIKGGAAYREAIFWKQSAGRISSSFAHQRPFWWYIPLLPVVFLPWTVFRPSFSKIRLRSADKGTRLALIWIAVPFILFSLISGKQLHYLIPLIPAGALLIGRNIARSSEEITGRKSVKVIGLLYLLSGLASLALPFIHLGTDIGALQPGATCFIAAGLLTAGLLLFFYPFRSSESSFRGLALSTAVIMCFGLFRANSSLMKAYDIKELSGFIKSRIDEGRIVVNTGVYHGQFHFLGRLTDPLPVLHYDRDTIRKFTVGNPDGILISYVNKKEIPENSIIYYKQPYRGKTVVLWNRIPPPAQGSGL